MDQQGSSTVALLLKFQFVMYALHLPLPKRQVIVRKAILLETARIVKAMAVNERSEISTVPKPQQSSLSTFLKAKRRPSIKPSSETLRLKPQETLPLTSTSTPPSTKKPRTLSTTAANGWKTTALATHLASEWLVVSDAKFVLHKQNTNVDELEDTHDREKGDSKL